MISASAVALVVLPATTASAAGTLYASPTGTGGVCSSPNPCSIQTAVSVATPGSTIILANGTYNAQLTISTNGLKIKGATVSSMPSVIIQPVGSPDLPNNEIRANPPANTPMNTIIGVQPGVTGVQILNLTVDGSQAGFACGQKWAGIMYKNATGLIQHVHITNMQTGAGGTTLTGCQAGDNIYVGTDPAVNPTPATVKIAYDTIDTYNKNGITCNGPTTICNVYSTVVTGSGPITDIAQNGIQFGFGGGGSIKVSKVSQNRYTPAPQASGILLYNSADNVLVAGSTVTFNDNNIYAINDVVNDPNAGPGEETKNVQIKTTKAMNSSAYDGITLDSVDGAIVTGNTLTFNAEYGLGIYGATNGQITNNHANKNTVAGIYVAGSGTSSPTASGNSVATNTAKSNTGPGIFADTGSSANTFTSNLMRYNNPDAKDTTGPANTWTTNNCITSSPPTGLC